MLRGDVEPTLTDQCMYLVSRDDCALYVGQSNNPVNRLKEHLGMRRSAERNLGLLIFCNLPASLSWQMHF
ncbi:MAG: GIY-YIG nuclease family protein [Ktedonobacteraceae bacterium]